MLSLHLKQVSNLDKKIYSYIGTTTFSFKPTISSSMRIFSRNILDMNEKWKKNLNQTEETNRMGYYNQARAYRI